MIKLISKLVHVRIIVESIHLISLQKRQVIILISYPSYTLLESLANWLPEIDGKTYYLLCVTKKIPNCLTP